MTMQITKAARKQAKLRVGVSGPSGSGKTYSALLLARGLATNWDNVLLIDSENGSGELYSDLGTYSVISLKAPFTPERYIEAIKAGEDAGMEVIVVDSITHEWDGDGGCLQLNEMLAASRYKGNTWSAWSETTPRHQRFLDTITSSRCHIITTVRNKTETVMGDDKKVKKVGTKEVTREGFEYELTVNFNIDRETHRVTVSKDRTNLFEKRDPFIITTATGEELMKWNQGGAVDIEGQKREVMFQFKRLGLELPPERHEIKPYVELIIPKLTGMAWSDESVSEVLAKLITLAPEMAAAALAPAPPAPTAEELATAL